MPGVLLLLAPALSMDQEFLECDKKVGEIRRLFSAKKTDYLEIEIADYVCTDSQFYEAFYYQGFGHYFISNLEDALLHFELARSLSGSWDEQVLYHIWKINRRLKDEEAQLSAYLEMKVRFPASPHLMEMGKKDNQVLPSRASIRFLNGIAHDNRYFGLHTRNYLAGGLSQNAGPHRFREELRLAGAYYEKRTAEPSLDAEVAVQYDIGRFGLEVGVGRSSAYVTRHTKDSLVLYLDSTTTPPSSGTFTIPLYTTKLIWDPSFSLLITQGKSLAKTLDLTVIGNYVRIGERVSIFNLGFTFSYFPGKLNYSFTVQGDRQESNLPENICTSTDDPLCGESQSFGGQTNTETNWIRDSHSVGLNWKLRIEKSNRASTPGETSTTLTSQYGYRLFKWLRLAGRFEVGGLWYQGGDWEPGVSRYDNIVKSSLFLMWTL